MKIERDENGGFVFSEVEPPLITLFLAIPAAADPEGSEAAMQRLFPQPVDAKEKGVCEEWAEYVQPELREGFENACATVEGDLAPLAVGDSLSVPAEHLDAWINALNQARIALAARFGMTDEEIDGREELIQDEDRNLALSQIHIYGLLQGYLISALDEE